jgi:hypothetical protein
MIAGLLLRRRSSVTGYFLYQRVFRFAVEFPGLSKLNSYLLLLSNLRAEPRQPIMSVRLRGIKLNRPFKPLHGKPPDEFFALRQRDRQPGYRRGRQSELHNLA